MIGPSTWKSMKKMKPDTAGTTIIGSRKYTIRSPRPRNSLTSSNASPNPSSPSTVVQTTSIRSVRENCSPELAGRQRLPVAVEPVPVPVGVPERVAAGRRPLRERDVERDRRREKDDEEHEELPGQHEPRTELPGTAGVGAARWRSADPGGTDRLRSPHALVPQSPRLTGRSGGRQRRRREGLLEAGPGSCLGFRPEALGRGVPLASRAPRLPFPVSSASSTPSAGRRRPPCGTPRHLGS